MFSLHFFPLQFLRIIQHNTIEISNIKYNLNTHITQKTIFVFLFIINIKLIYDILCFVTEMLNFLLYVTKRGHQYLNKYPQILINIYYEYPLNKNSPLI